MNYLVANWKSHKQLSGVKLWFDQINIGQINPNSLEIIICPPFPYLLDIADLIQQMKLPFKLGVQNISPFPFGSYTGEVAADMIADWVDYAIVGHSERRKYLSEDDQLVYNKTSESLKAGITPIVCIDEPYLGPQLKAMSKKMRRQIVVAYEPISAIGSGEPDTPEHADEVGERIKKLTDNKTPVLYGGSVTDENIDYYLNQTHINGALVGGASLDSSKFSAMINILSSDD